MAIALEVMNNKRLIFKCKACGKIWTHDYDPEQVAVKAGTPNERTITKYYRALEGIKTSMMDDTHRYMYDEGCVYCHQTWHRQGEALIKAISYDELKATLDVEHVCDYRCTNARGKDCSCECGGLNHGKKHLI